MPETETVVLVRTTVSVERDALGVPVEGTPGEVPIPGALVAWGPTAEVTVGQSTAAVDATVFLPNGSPVPVATDQIKVRGVSYEVVGTPADWTPSDPAAGIQVNVARSQ